MAGAADARALAGQGLSCRRERLGGLDAVRGIAIILVVIGHYLPGRVLYGPLETFVRPFAVGGVALFLLLSGFLIEQNLKRDPELISYGIRRISRIFPGYWVALALLIALDRAFIGTPGFGAPFHALANGLLVQDIVGATLVSGVFWTLLVETKFYVVAPFLARAGNRAIIAAPFVVMALNALLMARRGEASNLLTYLTCCLLGMNFSLWHRGELTTAVIIGMSGFAAASLGLFSPYYKIGLTIFGIINTAGLAYALRASSAPSSLVFIGAISYSWYLYHAGIGYPLMAAMEAKIGTVQVISTIVGVTVTLFVAWLSYRFVEQPGIALGRRLIEKLRQCGVSADALKSRG